MRKLGVVISLLFSLSAVAQDLDSILHQAHLLRNVHIDSSEKLVKFVLGKSRERGEKQMTARSLCHLGNLYRIRRQHAEAISVLNEGRALCYETGDSSTLSKIYNNTGLTFKSAGLYDSAIVYFHKCVSANPDEASNAFHNIGVIYSLLDKFDRSEAYFDKSMEAYRLSGDSLGVAKIINSKGSLFYDRGDYQKAKQFYFQYLSLLPPDKKLKREIALGNIGAAYEALNQLDTAFRYVSEALAISREINDDVGIIFNLSTAAGILRKQNKHLAAVRLYRQALALADSLNSLAEKKNLYYALSTTYETLGDYDSSLSYFRKYTDVKDSLINEKSNALIVKEQERYNAAEREKDIIALRAEKREKEQAERNLKFLLAGILIVVFIIALFVLFFLKVRNRQRLIEHERQVAFSMLDAEEKVKEEVSQEIHDNLASRLAYTRMLLSSVKKHVPEDKYTGMEAALLESMDLSRKISHKLFASDLKNLGIVPALRDFFADMDQLEEQRNFSFSSSGEIAMEWNKQLHLFRITQELVNNTLKYADATEIHLYLEHRNGITRYIYRDNGKGFNPAKVTKGLGLSGIANRVTQIGAEMKLDVSVGNGFQLTLIL